MSGLAASIRERLRASVAFAPTRRLALIVAVAAPIWLSSGSTIGFRVAVGVLLLALVAALIDGILLPSAADVTVERTAPATIGVGDTDELRYEVISRWGWPLLATVHHALPAAYLAFDDAGQDLVLSARGSATLTTPVSGRARGETPLGPVAIRVRSRYGLTVRTLRYPMDDRVVITPSLAGVRRFRWLAVHERLAAAGVRDARRRGEGRSFARLRDYVAGDDPRHIDWKATARRGHPITREFTIEQSQTVYLLLDAGRSMTQLSGAFPRFEYALSSALVLADVAVHAGDLVGMMAFDDQLRALVPAQRGGVALQAIRNALVPLVPTFVEPDYAAAFRALALRQRKRALLVMLTDVIDSRAARALLAHLSRGASRHLAIVVALRNETVLAAAVLPEGTRTNAFYTAAAAQELLSERATALQRMRDAGVVVLDVAPDAMAAAVVSKYLELKARGSL